MRRSKKGSEPTAQDSWVGMSGQPQMRLYQPATNTARKGRILRRVRLNDPPLIGINSNHWTAAGIFYPQASLRIE
jgi:hypothetical protein